METQPTTDSPSRTTRSSGATLYLCGGLQGSGSTLVSWCFLQHASLRGVLDGTFDLVPSLPVKRAGQTSWFKTTIACFRLAELAEHYADFGWQVRPLLVIRDVRDVWASLIKKPYGRNGTTAEDPPLRMRFRRFLADWQYFREHRLPILKFEDLVEQPETTLRQACDQLGLAWDPGMLSWPKKPAALGQQSGGNETFLHLRGGSLAETLRQRRDRQPASVAIAADDWHWLEYYFGEYNDASGYPVALPGPSGDGAPARGGPSFAATRRYRWETNRKPWRRMLSLLGIPNRRLLASRSSDKLL